MPDNKPQPQRKLVMFYSGKAKFLTMKEMLLNHFYGTNLKVGLGDFTTDSAQPERMEDYDDDSDN